MLTAKEAIQKLKSGNEKYLLQNTGIGDVSPAVRLRTSVQGQQPYAIIITCSDSRVIPECVFSAGIGELFVIRVAGNVIDDHQLGSIEYAVEHLGTNLVVMMGHTGCGAVEAAIHHDPSGFIKYITDGIRKVDTAQNCSPCLSVSCSVYCLLIKKKAGSRAHLRPKICTLKPMVKTMFIVSEYKQVKQRVFT